MNKQEKAYSRYCNSAYKKLLYLVFLPFVVWFLFQSFRAGDRDRVILGIFGLLICVAVPVKGMNIHRTYIEALRKTGMLEEIAQDFSQAEAFLSGTLRLGQRYVHVKNGVSFPYENITRVYPHVRRFLGANGVPVLIFEDGSEQIIGSIDLPRRGRSRQALTEVVDKIRENNPDISLTAV